MRAAILADGSDRLQVADLDIAEPVGREVVVRTMAAGLCHSDYHYVDGTLRRPRPMLLGHEGGGVVEAVGSDVRTVQVGDHVVTCLVMGCGECSRCRRGEPTRCLHPEVTKRPAGAAPRLTVAGIAVGQMSNVGSFAERMILDERAVTVVPADIPMQLACVLGCAVVTGLGAIFNTARVAAGDTVAVIGCGGVGLNIIQGARIAGASAIIAVDANADKLARATALGATHAVDASATDALAAVRDLSDGGVDHAFEVVGRPALVRQAFEMAAPGRAAYVVGVQADESELTVPAIGMRRGKRLVGVFMGDTRPSIDIPRYAAMFSDGRLDLSSLVSHTISLDEVNEGFAMMVSGQAARTVITF